jgi:glycosyltransferase involved in cell wall biosynthesis
LALPGKRILIIVENLPLPFDKRVWNEAGALRDVGCQVAAICPVGKGYEKHYEQIDGIAIYRHPMLPEADGPMGYISEYIGALFWEFFLTLRIFLTRGFDVIQACNPPDTIFVVGFFFKLFGKKFIFDHHDINPELYVAKFGKRGLLYKGLVLLERFTFMMADISIATNESYRQIAINRGRMDPTRVYVVRSGPNLKKLIAVPPRPELRKGRTYLVGYVGVMGKQEGINLLLEAAYFVLETKNRKDVLFVIIGHGTEFEPMRSYAASLGLSDSVVFTGRIPDKDLIDYLSTCDVCVNPDVVNEMNDKSTMNKIMEYMALAKPIVQFDMTEGRFTAQSASLYAKANDPKDFGKKILELLDDPEVRKTMGIVGRERVIHDLQWEQEKPKYIAAYSHLFKRT